MERVAIVTYEGMGGNGDMREWVATVTHKGTDGNGDMREWMAMVTHDGPGVVINMTGGLELNTP